MGKIIVDSTQLELIACELDTDCSFLSMVYDEEDIDDVEFYSSEIQRAADMLRQIVETAEPAEVQT